MRSLCVVGLGLIGGSVLRAATAAGWRAWGATTDEAEVAAARAEGFDVEPAVPDALARTVESDALIVLAVPLPSLDAVLRQIAEHAPAARITDVVSVKEPVLAAIRRRLPSARYVGGHPMAGAAASGWAAGSAGLFAEAPWVVTTDSVDPEDEPEDEPEDDLDEPDELANLGDLAEPDDEPDPARGGRWDAALWAEVASLALDCGAHVVPATAAEHDAVAARISHLPHVFATVLATVGADGGPLALALAAGSFGDGTRVAGSRPELVRAMCEGNRDALLDALDDALGRLGAARGSLASTGSLAKTVESGHQARQALLRQRSDGGRGPSVRIELASASARSRLLALGRGGGRITAVDGCTALGTAAPAE